MSWCPGRPDCQLNATRAAFRGDFVFLAGFQFDETRSRCWKPHVVQIDDVLPVDFDHEVVSVVAAEEETVDAFSTGGEFALPGSWIDGYGLVGRIEVGQGRIVPEDSIYLAGQQKRNRMLCSPGEGEWGLHEH